MIMLADQVLDARPDQETVGGLNVVVRRNAFGRQVDSFEMDIDLPALGGEPFHAVFIRAPWVESVGEDVQVLAEISSGDRAGTIVAVRQGPRLATSFHPELTHDDRVHRYFMAMVEGKA
jgi:5'-phosphate synthase pdxT subunit